MIKIQKKEKNKDLKVLLGSIIALQKIPTTKQREFITELIKRISSKIAGRFFSFTSTNISEKRANFTPATN